MVAADSGQVGPARQGSNEDAPEPPGASSGASGRADFAHAEGLRARLGTNCGFRWTRAIGWGRSFGIGASDGSGAGWRILPGVHTVKRILQIMQ